MKGLDFFCLVAHRLQRESVQIVCDRLNLKHHGKNLPYGVFLLCSE